MRRFEVLDGLVHALIALRANSAALKGLSYW